MKKILGIEFGSTRIKTILIDENTNVLAKGSYEWENCIIDGLWSYKLEDIIYGLQESYKNLVNNYGYKIERIDSIGISGMMHGYLAFDKDENLLVPFRTWRNTNTSKAAEELSTVFNFNIPMRWTCAHYYESIIEKQDHVSKVNFLTTIGGYVHYKLTNKRVLGIGEASGVFPVSDNKYDSKMMRLFNDLLKKHDVDVNFENLIPSILLAGENAGTLTKEGALILDPTGTLKEGALFCPPEGDMQTSMVSTNAIFPGVASASLGTSANITVILDRDLKKCYQTIDCIKTPVGNPACIIHNNTCTSEINTWVNIFYEIIKLSGGNTSKEELYTKLFNLSLSADNNLGIASYNLFAGEPTLNLLSGKPLIIREANKNLTLANFMESQIYSALATISIGFNILEKEDEKPRLIVGQGGFFKTDFVGQNVLSAACKTPVSVLKNAGEGGSWGMAILALYLFNKEVGFNEFLNEIFKNDESSVVMASNQDIEKYENFIKDYLKYLPVEKLSTEV